MEVSEAFQIELVSPTTNNDDSNQSSPTLPLNEKTSVNSKHMPFKRRLNAVKMSPAAAPLKFIHLVKRSYNCAWLVNLALILSIVVSSLTVPSVLIEAKTHHSKRQAPSLQTSSTPLTGRENTNWWNLWWQRK